MQTIASHIALGLLSIAVLSGCESTPTQTTPTATPAPAQPTEPRTHLFVLSGQSNMAGMDPNVSFTPTVTSALASDTVIVVKSAQSGQPIRRWHKKWKPATGDAPESTGDLYDVMMEKIHAAVGETVPDTVTFLWMQGERDAREQHGEVYAASMRGLIDQFAADMKRTDVNFVIGRLSDFSNGNTRYKHWDEVRAAQMKVADDDPRGAWIDTDDLNDKPDKNGGTRNDLHMTKDGYKLMGERFADAALKLIADSE